MFSTFKTKQKWLYIYNVKKLFETTFNILVFSRTDVEKHCRIFSCFVDEVKQNE